jgi:hypothetical protein
MRAVKEWADLVRSGLSSVQVLHVQDRHGFPSHTQVVAEASSEALGDLLSLLEAREVEQS